MARSFPQRIRRGVRSSARSNAAVYGYSVMITSSFGVLQVTSGPLNLGRIFLFIGGAGLAFASVELLVLAAEDRRVREETSEVVVLGSALGLVSISAGAGAAALVGHFVDGWVAWGLASLVGTVLYLLVVALELAVAEQIADRED